MSDQPPVFVMNLYYTGIGIARNLHRLGVGVFGLSSERDAPGMQSRFLRRVYMVPNGRDQPQALYERLMEIRPEHTLSPVIFPTRDIDVMFLHDYADALRAHYRLPPLGDGLSVLMDKLRLAAVAREQRIAVPRTELCRSEADVERVIASFSFPIVIKPRIALQWRQAGAWQKVGGRKAILVDNPDQLWDEYRNVATVSNEVLLQEYIAGEDSDIVVCCCYV